MPIQSPPAIPGRLNTPETISNYLNSLSQWMQSELQQCIRKDEATNKLVLSAYDTKTNPNVFQVQVTNAGALQANPAPLGGGRP